MVGPAPADDAAPVRGLRERAAVVLAIAIGVFVFYTAFFGTFETLVQRALFVALIVALGVLMFPLGAGTRWRPIGIVVDAAMVAIVAGGVGFIIVQADAIMTRLPWADNRDVALAGMLLLCILELARRCSSWVFPLIVALTVVYAVFGDAIPGRLGHRGFDVYYLTEVLFLSDRGFWGMLVGVASTTLAVFVLFGALLLHTGAGQAFFDLSARAGGDSPGGAAKMATIGSGLFGMINGSTVANVATTGNFTIPMMKRLGYPPAYAGAVEAVASTGGQLAPPIMGTAAFVMAELLGVNYWRIVAAAVIPALLFYVAVLGTVHFAAARQNLNRMDRASLPSWLEVLSWRRLAPTVAALGGLIVGIFRGHSIEFTACLGMVAMTVAFVAVTLAERRPLSTIPRALVSALEDGGRGVVTVGLMLVGAQIFVAIVNLTGFGVAATGLVLSAAQGQIWLIAVIMALVCLISGMGLPTSAAYVLVAAVFAPALIQQGIDPLTVHFFVLYYACLSVITPPVCVGVFVAATIARTPWLAVAMESLRLGAAVYALPMLFLIYPGMLGHGDWADAGQALGSGLVFVLGLGALFGGRGIVGRSGLIRVAWLVPAGLALVPGWLPVIAGAAMLMGLLATRGGAQPSVERVSS